MLGLFENQRSAFKELTRLLESTPPRRGLLVGPAGSGKSWILERLYEDLDDSGEVVWLASGYAQDRTRSFEPFNAAISRKPSKLSARRIRVQGLSALSRAIPVFGGIAAFATEWLANEKQRKRREKMMHLGSNEFEVLSHLAYGAEQSEMILLADNLQHWDSDSLKLLLDLLGDRLQPAFEFVRKLRIVATLSEDAARVQDPELVQEVVEVLGSTKVVLPRISRDEVNTALLRFGLFSALSAADADLIFSLTGGHLALLKHLTHYLRSGTDTEYKLSTLTPGQLAPIFTERFESLGKHGADTRTLLEAAAVIGEVSLIEEIACATKLPQAVIDKLISDSSFLALFSRVARSIRFKHEIVRECILASLGGVKELHETIAACLSRLRPWDFRTRAEHCLHGGNRSQAAWLLFAENYRRHREGIPITDADENRAMLLLSEIGENQIGTLLTRSIHALREGRWDDMERMLECVPDTAHAHFVGEKLLLLATLRMKSTKMGDRQEALQLLRSTQGLNLEEPDLQLRIQLTLLTALVHTNALGEARELYLRIAQRLGQLGKFDPYADWMLHVLHRKSGMIFGAERAAHLCEISTEYFGPQDENEPPRSSSQYYMALTNLAGNLLCCGRFRDAAAAAAVGLQIWENFSRFHIAKRDKCVANFALAAFFAGDISAGRALETMETGIETERNSWFLRSNRAVLRALSGDIERALEELTAAASELDSGHYRDPHHRFIIRTNLAGLLHLVSRTDEGMELWRKLALEMPPLNAQDEPFFIDRQKLQLPAFTVVAPGDAQGWFDFLQRAHPNHVGYGWAFWGRGFLLSDVQLWTES